MTQQLDRRIDLLTGALVTVGRPVVPIVGRFCVCGHNHPQNYRRDFYTLRIQSTGKPGRACNSCPCRDFKKAGTE